MALLHVVSSCRMTVWLVVACLLVNVVSGFLQMNFETRTRSSFDGRLYMMQDTATSSSSRRSLLLKTTAAAATATFGVLPVSAETTSKLTSFQDTDCGFQISVPENWKKNEQTLPDRRKLLLFQDPSDDKTLLFVAYTPIRDDYTSLASFGSAEQVAQMTILPKSQLAGVESKSEMLKAESKKNAYYFDYKAEAGGQPMTHFRTIFSMASGATGGAGAVLVTLTAQTPESRYSELKPTFDDIMNSYGKV